MIVALTVSLFPSSGIEGDKGKRSKDENKAKKIDLLNKNDLEGTFFKAVGIDTVQTVSISKKGIVYVSSRPNQKIIFPYVEPKTEGEGRVYVSETKHEKIEIVIYEDEASKEFWDGRFDHSVAVSVVRKQELRDIVLDFACFGFYIYDDILSGNWIIQSYEDKRVEELQIHQIPLICIDTKTRSFSGSGGNHMVYGSIRCEGDFINFKILDSPEYTSDQYLQEKELLEVLERCNKFGVKDDVLELYENKKLKFKFFRDTY